MEFVSVEGFLGYFENSRGRTLRVARCIPADKIEWSPGSGRWTFGDLLRHLASLERFMWAENVKGRPSRYPGHGRDLADGYESVMAYLDRMHAEAMDIFRTLSEEDMRAKCETPAGTPITVWKWLRGMIEHEIHHRGQIYVYLGLLGIATPPLFGLTSEQVRERSHASGV